MTVAALRVRLARLQAESLLAAAAAGVGALGVFSALTPELASRLDLVRAVVPAAVPNAARLATLAFGLALLGLARSLAGRRRRAWQLATALVLGIALAHLVKGLDVEEALVSLALLVALLRYRARFQIPGDPAARRPLLATAIMVAGAGGIAFALATRGVLPDRLESTLVAGGLVLGLWALWLWLRPLSEHVLQSIEERRLVRELVGSYGNDSLAFFALRHDKSYFFSASGRAFLAYRVLGAIALVSGDPVGDEDDFASLLGEFAHYVHRSGWRVALLGVSRRHLGLYRRLDLRPIKLGEEAVLRPEHFSLEGRAIRKVRQAWQHLERAGCSFAVSAADALSPEKRREIEAISQAWLDGKPERGFSMTIDDLFTPETILAVCLDPSGKPLGFLHLVPCAGGRCYSLSTMRRLPEAPNGATEFLVVETLAWARRHGVEELSLNFCAFRSLLAEEGREIPRRAARRLLLTFDGVFQLERLHLFSRKFLPEWRPRYVCVERIGDVPAVGIAYLRAESLIAPPRRRLRRRSPVAG